MYFHYYVHAFRDRHRDAITRGCAVVLACEFRRINCARGWMCVCMYGSYGAYNCYGLAGQVSESSIVSVSAQGTRRIVDCWI